jgi:7,8-dihydropterin-6-yl-methyl-4-(beta-D-ribofuranosyl)aminobenzene 5'-phosphate synthase
MLTIVYDNNAGGAGLTPAWGFACFIRGLEKTILFDTGGDGRTLTANMRQLGLSARDVDAIVLSHAHGDHTGGLSAALHAAGDVPIYLSGGFDSSFEQQLRRYGAEPVVAEDSTRVCDGAVTTGTLDGGVEEHGLCVRTEQGWVLLTGCAHPGVDRLAEAAEEVTGGPLRLVVGGFHMGGYSDRQVRGVIEAFRGLGVQQVAPCHCTGSAARGIFASEYGDDYVDAHVGTELRLPATR